MSELVVAENGTAEAGPIFEEDHRSAADRNGKTCALCVHGIRKKCHEGECCRNDSAASKKSAKKSNAKQKMDRALGIDVGSINTKARKDAGIDTGTNNRRAKYGARSEAEKKDTAAKKKFENIKAKLIEAGAYVSDSEITITLDEYFAHGGRKSEKKDTAAKKKFENIKAKLMQAGTYVSDSEIRGCFSCNPFP